MTTSRTQADNKQSASDYSTSAMNRNDSLPSVDNERLAQNTKEKIHPMNNRANSDEDGTDDDGNQNTHGCKQRKTFARQTASSSSKRIVQEQTDEDTDSKGDSSSDVYSISDTTDNSEEDNSSDEDDDVRFQRFTGKKRGQYRVKSHLIAEIAEKESIKIDYAPSQQSPSLSRDQEFITELVVEKGENIFFTGPAGVGKSFTLNSIIDRLKSKFSPESVAVTATTGVAALQIGGTTLHSFAGIGLGDKKVEVHCAIIRNWAEARNRWLKAKVLVIDEVSMLNAELFDKLETIARTIRSSTRPFGGIQVVLCGDFFQLPPVGKGSLGQTQFAFESESWSKVIGSNMVELTQIFRQTDANFVGILNQLRMNQLTPDSIDVLKSLERPLPARDGIEPTELFSLRAEVEGANNKRLKALPGKEVVYKAVDWAKNENLLKKLKSNCIAPEELRLKIGAQVMLLYNVDIGAGLVNGAVGQVLEIDPETQYPTVKFVVSRRGKESTITVEIGPQSWTVEEKRQPIMERRQIPLALAWAWSIHKSQGQTISYLKVNLGRIFENGQAYVALSRAVSLEQLQVVGFSENKVKVHPKVVHFNEQILAVQSTRTQQ